MPAPPRLHPDARSGSGSDPADHSVPDWNMNGKIVASRYDGPSLGGLETEVAVIVGLGIAGALVFSVVFVALVAMVNTAHSALFESGQPTALD